MSWHGSYGVGLTSGRVDPCFEVLGFVSAIFRKLSVRVSVRQNEKKSEIGLGAVMVIFG